MPKLNTTVVRHCIAEHWGGRTAEVAEAAGIPYGSLRNAIAGRDPLRLYRIYDLARVLDRPVDDLIAGSKDDGVPTEPPGQPKPPPKDPGRGPKDPKGPKREAVR